MAFPLRPLKHLPHETRMDLTKQKLKQRIQELDARRLKAMKLNLGRPTWLSKAAIMDHIKGVEMASLSRESDFAKIPAELQLHIISYMEYPAVLELKRTCKYFNYFINSDVMKESRAFQKEALKQQERRGRLPADRYPCYTCLKLKSSTEYYNVTSSSYYNTTPANYYTRATPVPLNDYTRRCIRCNFMGGHYKAGLQLATGGENWMICSACGLLCKNATARYSYRSPEMCRPCSVTFDLNKGLGSFLRMLQFVVAVVIMPLACTGQFMPWTSRADHNSLRWILNITLDLLTIGGCFASICTRVQNNYGGYRNKRSENHRFERFVEIPACACWIAILVSIFTQAKARHFTGRYDRFAKGLTAMTVVECLLFVLTALLSVQLTKAACLKGRRRLRMDYV